MLAGSLIALRFNTPCPASLHPLCQASIAVAVGPGDEGQGRRLVLLCVLGSLALIPLTSGKPTASRKPMVWSMSMMTSAWYGSIIVLAANVGSLEELWLQVCVDLERVRVKVKIRVRVRLTLALSWRWC